MTSSTSAASIKTRFLILSDTHGQAGLENNPTQQGDVDVIIHCGDLSDSSTLEEYRTSLQLLRELDAPLKLVIPGNHDFTMDKSAFERLVEEATPCLEPEQVKKDFGAYGEAQDLFAQEESVMLLNEGTHKFILLNGALLTVYASPYTPALGTWGFQFHDPDHGHDFAIKPGTDLVITHSPPRGVLDFTLGRERAGSPQLFRAVARNKPRLHCFGHIHEAHGGKLVTWKPITSPVPSHFTDIDNERSVNLETLRDLKPSSTDTLETKLAKEAKAKQYSNDGCYKTSHCEGDSNPLEFGKQTLFINASIMSDEGKLVQKPWLVDIKLPKAAKGPGKGV